MTEPCLSAEGLAVLREKNGSRFSLLVPSLKASFGQMLAVTGASGCGKSTLLDVLALILRPQTAASFAMRTGTGMEDVFKSSPRRLARLRGAFIGYVLQSGGLLYFLSVRDNIMMPGRLQGLPDGDLRRRADGLAERLGIADQMDKKPMHLSGGQRQRAAIARALVHRPGLVLADEPTAAVDQDSAAEICDVFRDAAREQNAALIVVSHDRALMGRFADAMVTFRLERRAPGDVRSVVVPEGRA